MPTTINVSAQSGVVLSQDNATSTAATNFANARNADTATAPVTIVDLTDDQDLMEASIFTGRGNPIARIRRIFYSFDTSGITGTVSEAILKLGLASSVATDNDDFIVVKASKPDTSTDIAAADFDAIPGFTDDASMSGNVTDYSSEIDSIAGSAYTEITLNSTARSDIQSLDAFALACVEHTHDYSNTTPGSGGGSSIIQISLAGKDNTNSGLVPLLVVTEAATGYTHNVLGVAAANIAKVDGVATANIGKINGVD